MKKTLTLLNLLFSVILFAQENLIQNIEKNTYLVNLNKLRTQSDMVGQTFSTGNKLKKLKSIEIEITKDRFNGGILVLDLFEVVDKEYKYITSSNSGGYFGGQWNVRDFPNNIFLNPNTKYAFVCRNYGLNVFSVASSDKNPYKKGNAFLFNRKPTDSPIFFKNKNIDDKKENWDISFKVNLEDASTDKIIKINRDLTLVYNDRVNDFVQYDNIRTGATGQSFNSGYISGELDSISIQIAQANGSAGRYFIEVFKENAPGKYAFLGKSNHSPTIYNKKSQVSFKEKISIEKESDYAFVIRSSNGFALLASNQNPVFKGEAFFDTSKKNENIVKNTIEGYDLKFEVKLKKDTKVGSVKRLDKIFDTGSQGVMIKSNVKSDANFNELRVLFVDFPDHTANNTDRAKLWDIITTNGSLANSLQIQGLNNLQTTFVGEGWKRMPKNLNTEVNENGTTIKPYYKDGQFEYLQYVKDAVKLFEKQNFNNNVIPVVVINKSLTSFTSGAHNIEGWSNISDKKNIKNIITLGADLYNDNYTVMVHEIGHTYGAKDLYPFKKEYFKDNNDEWKGEYRHRIGGYAVMGDVRGATGFVGYNRFRNGWLKKERTLFLNEAKTYDKIKISKLGYTNGTSTVVIPDSADKLFIIEIGQEVIVQRTNDTINKPSDRLIVYSVERRSSSENIKGENGSDTTINLPAIKLLYRSTPINQSIHLSTAWLDSVSFKEGDVLNDNTLPFKILKIEKIDNEDAFEIKVQVTKSNSITNSKFTIIKKI